MKLLDEMGTKDFRADFTKVGNVAAVEIRDKNQMDRLYFRGDVTAFSHFVAQMNEVLDRLERFEKLELPRL